MLASPTLMIGFVCFASLVMHAHVPPFLQSDLLHPLTFLQWNKCDNEVVSVDDAQVIWLNGKLYLGRRYTSQDKDCGILCCNGDMKSCTFIEIPS